MDVYESLLVGLSGWVLALDSVVGGLAAGFSFSFDTSTFVFETLFLI
jgi:small basic protein